MHDEMKEQFLTLPMTIKKEEQKLLDMNKELERLNGQKKYWQRKISAQVYHDKDAEFGKRLFTNDAMREVETDARLSLLPDYQQIIEQEVTQAYLAKLSKIEIDYLERQFKSLQYLVKLLEIEK